MFARNLVGRAAAGAAVAAAAVAASAPAAWSSGAGGDGAARSARAELLANTPPAPALSPADFRPFKLAAKEQLTHDTARYTFALPRENDELGLAVASCLVVRAEVDGKPVVRPYTPVSPVSRRGSFDLVVKEYPAGNVSRALAALPIGGALDFKGPFPKFRYERNAVPALGMIAGGTGIAPMYQVLAAILADPRDNTQVRLLYASRSPADVILRDELDALAAAHPNFKVLYTADEAAPAAAWGGRVGVVNADMVASFLPPPREAGGAAAVPHILVCGPPGMMKALSGDKKSATEQGDLTGLLRDMHYSAAQVFKF